MSISKITCFFLASLTLGCSAKIVGNIVDYEPDGVPFGSYRIFVTSVLSDGNLGGLSGADQRCASAAASAGLSLSYKAVLGVNGAGSESRFPRSGVIYSLDASAVRRVVTQDKRNFFKDSPGLVSPPQYDEFGRTHTERAWTGGYGTSSVGKCNGWVEGTSGAQGQIGDPLDPSAPARWILLAQGTCDELHSLYCMAFAE